MRTCLILLRQILQRLVVELLETAAKSKGKQTFKRQLGSGNKKRIYQTRGFVPERCLYKHLSLLVSDSLRYQLFVEISGSRGKSPGG